MTSNQTIQLYGGSLFPQKTGISLKNIFCINLYLTSQVKTQRTFLLLSFQNCNCTWMTPDALNEGKVLGQHDNDIDNWKKKRLFDVHVMINEYMKKSVAGFYT